MTRSFDSGRASPWTSHSITGLRNRLAFHTGRAAAGAVRRAGRAGGVIGGRVAEVIGPQLLGSLTTDPVVVLVSGTNGKTTSTAMIDAAIRAAGHRVACNRTGANMPDGALAALLDTPDAGYAVLEVDEPHLPRMITELGPDVVVLLNLSRDQLDRIGEVRTVTSAIAAALRRRPGTTVVANSVDPNVVAAASAAEHAVWVRVPHRWTGDAVVCPVCSGSLAAWDADGGCVHCGLRRPEPDWDLDGRALRTGDSTVGEIPDVLPGRANRINAAFAVAAAGVCGVPAATALAAIAAVRDVAGRYRVFEHGGRSVRLLLAKNPAGWQETLDVVGTGRGPIVVAVNSREADGRDPSWLWDVPLERLRGRDVVASGDRAADVAVRLTYGGVVHRVCPGVAAAVAACPPGAVDVVADYTSFVATRARLRGPL